MKAAYSPHEIHGLTPLHDNTIVCDLVFDERITRNGIVLLNDNGRSEGIRPRWCKVYAIGPDQKDVTVGQYVLISHGRWTRGVKIDDGDGVKTIHRVDNADILMVSDEPVFDEILGDKV
jgi:co-chaperonin GroES (HSP10)